MGLDCFLTAKCEGDEPVLLQNPIPGHSNTWRKYWDLHEYMEKLWRKTCKPAEDEEFNTVEFEISSKQLEKFFRENDPDFDCENDVCYEVLTKHDEDISDAEFWRNWNRQLLDEAKQFEADGYTLYYYSWF
jgi:hypothetical protein